MLLFLDIDGVLHPVSGSAPFRPECLTVLASTLFPHPGIEIVITSSWREEKTHDELKQLLGPTLGDRMVGVTPVIDEPFLHHVRYHEVQAYLESTNQTALPWVALDDERGNYPEGAPVLLTDRRTGLIPNDEHRLRALISSTLAEL